MRCRIVLLLLHDENVYSKETFIAQEFVRNNRINCSCLLLESVVILESTLSTEFPTDRSSQQRCSMKNRVLRNFAKFTGKHLCQKRRRHRYFPVNFAKFLRIIFLQNTSGRLFLQRVLFEFSIELLQLLYSYFEQFSATVSFSFIVFFVSLVYGCRY